MSIIIREADLEADRDVLIGMLSRYLSPHANGVRYDWLYCANPYGPAQVWLATDTSSDTIIGVAGAFPRLVYVDNHEVLSWVLGDFCIHDQYRSLGPALQLQRACIEGLNRHKVAFCYDLPSRRMMAIYQRLRIESSFNMVRLVMPLRVDRKVRDHVSHPLAARMLSGLGNLCLGLYHRCWQASRAVTVAVHHGYCGAEFSTLARQIGGRYGISVKRSEAYLNWRYLDHPHSRYEMMTAHHKGVLAAYVVFTHDGDDATLVDLFGIDNAEVMSALILQVIAHLRQRSAITVSALISQSHPWRALMQRLGFKERETTPVVIYIPPCMEYSNPQIREARWLLMHGDRES